MRKPSGVFQRGAVTAQSERWSSGPRRLRVECDELWRAVSGDVTVPAVTRSPAE